MENKSDPTYVIVIKQQYTKEGRVMKNKTIFHMVIDAIKSFFTSTSGQMLMHEVQLPKEVRDYEIEILSDLEMRGPREDKVNLKQDATNFKKDVHKAVDSYYSERVYG